MEKKRLSYLDKLKFNRKLKDSLIAKYLTNFRYVLLFVIGIVVIGAFSYFKLPRRLNPEVKIPIVTVTTILAGAGPEDVESLLTIPLEDEIVGVENISRMTSTSAENFSNIIVEFNSGVDPDKAKDDVKSAVETVTKLPGDAQTPKVIKLDFENQPVWRFLVTTNADTASLEQFSENLKDKIEKIPAVKQVSLSGIEEQEIQVLIKPEARRDFKIDPVSLSRAIQAAVPSYPAGTIDTANSSFALTIDPSIKSAKEIRDLNIIVDETPLRLEDVATVMERSKPQQPKTFFASESVGAQRAVAFSVFKTESANIDKAQADVKKVTDEEISSNSQFSLVSTSDLSKLIGKQYQDLAGSLRDTIILVIITLLVFLGIRQALIVAFSIPLSFLVAFAVMNAAGLSLNFLSLFSLILALGLLVDDAIVTVTAVTAYWRTGKFSPNETGLLVLRDFIVPIFSTTITAVWAFLPLLIATGIIGEFIKSIPIVVSTTLLASTTIAILITLPTFMIFLSPHFPRRVRILLWLILFALLMLPIFAVSKNTPFVALVMILAALFFILTYTLRTVLAKRLLHVTSKWADARSIAQKMGSLATHGLIDSQKFAASYQKVIEKVLASRTNRVKTIATVIIFAIFSYSLLPAGFVVNEFFPKTNQDNIFVQIELPTGTNLKTTETETESFLENLRAQEGVDFVVGEAGKFQDVNRFAGSQNATNNILYTLTLKEKDNRKRSSIEIAKDLRTKFESYPKGKLTVQEITGGPPAGADLQLQIFGSDMTILNNYADKVIDFLKSQPGTTSFEKSPKPGTSKLVFVPDRTKMAENGLSEDQIGRELRTFASGFTLDRDVKIEGQTQDITFRTNSDTQNPQSLTTQTITTPNGERALSEIGRFKLEPNPSQITHENQKRAIAATAGVTKGYSLTQLNQKLENFAKNNLKLPKGYEWKTGGVNEENQKSVNSILQAMVIAFFLIATTMVAQFGSFRKAFITLLLIPLAISGVFVMFALTGTPLSFPTLVGILALFGIVVYQGMMIVDRIARNERTGMDLAHAIADGAASRVEPILFGTITTVMGLIPITLTDPLWRGLGGAIIAGMLFSGGIMLLFIPVVYYLIYQKEEH